MARWDPFDGMEALRREIDQAFDRVSPQFPPMFRTAFLPARGAREYPLINLYEDQNTVYLEALAPGADPGSFNISIVKDTLTLSGENVFAIPNTLKTGRLKSGKPRMNTDETRIKPLSREAR